MPEFGYIIMGRANDWYKLNIALFTEKDEAITEAEARLNKFWNGEVPEWVWEDKDQLIRAATVGKVVATHVEALGKARTAEKNKTALSADMAAKNIAKAWKTLIEEAGVSLEARRDAETMYDLVQMEVISHDDMAEIAWNRGEDYFMSGGDESARFQLRMELEDMANMILERDRVIGPGAR